MMRNFMVDGQVFNSLQSDFGIVTAPDLAHWQG